MLVFERPKDAVHFGKTIIEACGADDDLPPLHIGAHHGPLLSREGDYFGNGVNLAARVTSASEAGQFVVTRTLVEAAQLSVDETEALPPRELKGIAETPDLYAVRL
jgi:adenylate cyclase